MQGVYGRVRDLGAELVSISPQDQAYTTQTAKDLDLSYPVLADQGQTLARELGLVFSFNEPMKAAYRSFGVNLSEYNGDDSWTLPMPAAFILRSDGLIAYRFVDADYTRRMEPEEVVAELRKLV